MVFPPDLHRWMPFFFFSSFMFSYQKSAAFFFLNYVKPLLQLVLFVLNELENQCITHVNLLLLLVLTSLNRGLATSPAFCWCWLCSLKAEAVSSVFFWVFFWLAFWLHWSGKKNLTVCWMNWASAAGQKGNVINLRKLPCFSAGLSRFGSFFFFFTK